MIKHRDDKLTKEEELELGRKVQEMNFLIKTEKGSQYNIKDFEEEERKVILEGERALETLISNYINLARSMTSNLHKKTGTKYPEEDLLQDAISALVEAAKAYDPSKNCRLSTYAYYGIRKKVSSTINYQRLVRLPENKMGEYIKITDAQRDYHLLCEKDKSKYKNELDYVYIKSGVKKEEVDLILDNMQPQIYLNASSMFEGRELIDTLVDKKAEEERSIVSGLDPSVEKVINKLTPFQKDLVAFEFGLFSPSVDYDEFLKINNLTDKKVKNEIRKTITVMSNLAKKMGLSLPV